MVFEKSSAYFDSITKYLNECSVYGINLILCIFIPTCLRNT